MKSCIGFYFGLASSSSISKYRGVGSQRRAAHVEIVLTISGIYFSQPESNKVSKSDSTIRARLELISILQGHECSRAGSRECIALAYRISVGRAHKLKRILRFFVCRIVSSRNRSPGFKLVSPFVDVGDRNRPCPYFTPHSRLGKSEPKFNMSRVRCRVP